MKITKAIITATDRRQQTLPLQTLRDRDGVEQRWRIAKRWGKSV
jgi:hypothetical protein